MYKTLHQRVLQIMTNLILIKNELIKMHLLITSNSIAICVIIQKHNLNMNINYDVENPLNNQFNLTF